MKTADIERMIEKAKKNGWSSLDLGDGYLLACVPNTKKTDENPTDFVFYKVDKGKFGYLRPEPTVTP